MAIPFEFQPGDAEALRDQLTKLRKYAANNPCHRPIEATDPAHSFKFGPWHISFTLDAWNDKRMWHGSVAVLEQVAEQPTQFPNGLIAYVPVDAMITTQSYSDEHKAQAKFLLGELMGPYIREATTPVHEHTGLMAIHWLTPCVSH